MENDLLYAGEQSAKPQDSILPASNDEADIVAMCERFYREASGWMAPAFKRARRARAYYNLNQWTPAQRAQLRADGKPDLVIALIPKAIDNVCGRERATRYDWVARPVGGSDVMTASAMTHALKNISDQTNAKYTISDAFEDAAKGPMGWLETTMDDTDPTREPAVVGDVDPFEMLFDPFSRKRDLDDSRYLIRERDIDLDIACEINEKKADNLRAAVTLRGVADSLGNIMSDYDNLDDNRPHVGFVGDTGLRYERPRVKVREVWYWRREDADFLETADGKVFEFDPTNEEHLTAAGQGGELVSGKKRVYYMALIAAGQLLYHGKSDLPFGFPYTPVWCKRDAEGRPYGLIDVMIDPQNEVNVARSRLNESLRSRHLIAGAGALGNTTATDAAALLTKANFVLEVNDINQVRLGSDSADSQMWLQLMEMSKKEIDDVVGQNEASYGDKSNERSAVAIERRVQQQALNLGKIFDNLRYARKDVGEKLVALMQKYYKPEKIARIIESQLMQGYKPGLMQPNGMPSVPPPDLGWVGEALAGPIHQLRFDVTIDDQSETATQRQAELENMKEIFVSLPDELKGLMLPDLIRGTDYKGSAELAQRVEGAVQAAQAPPAMMGAPPGAPPTDIPAGAMPELPPGFAPGGFA